MNIENYIPYGRDNAISKSELISLTGMTERAVRRAIERARESGIMIMSSSQVRGYWQTEDIAEMEDFVRQTDNRIKALYFAKAKMQAEICKAKNIKTVTVREHKRRV